MLAAVVAFVALVVALVALARTIVLRNQTRDLAQGLLDIKAPKVSRQPDLYRTMDDAA